MFRISCLFALILFSGGFSAWAGIITCEQDAPVVEMDTLAMPAPSDAPEEPIRLIQESNLGLSVSSPPSQSFPLSAITNRERPTLLTLDSERIRAWNAALPPSPDLDSLLKPV